MHNKTRFSGIRVRPFLCLTFVVLAAIALNIIVGLVVSGYLGSTVFQKQDLQKVVVGSALLDGSNYLLATADNYVLLFENDEVARSKLFPAPILSIAVSKDAGRIYVGCTDQNVYVLGPSFSDIDFFTVNGRIKDIEVMQDGRIIVAYGIGEYSDRWYLSQFSTDGIKGYTHRIGFNTKAVASLGMEVFFGTRDSRIGKVSEEGVEIWRVTLTMPIEKLSALPSSNDIAVSDEGGNIHVLDADGKIKWQKKISEYTIRTVAWDRRSLSLLAGDESGRFYLLNSQGKLIYKNRIFTKGVRSLLVSEDGIASLVSFSGEKVSISIGAALKGRLIRFARVFRRWFNIAASLLAVGLLVESIISLRRRAALVGQLLYKGRMGYLLVLPSVFLPIALI